MLPTRQPQSSVAHRFRGLSAKPHKPSPQSRSNASKISSVPSCTMPEKLTQHFLPHSVPLQHAKAMAQWQWRMHVTNSSTTSLHIPMQEFDTRRATWYYQYTRTRHTFLNPAVKVKQPVVSNSPIAMMKTSTMALFSPCQPPSNTSYCQPPRLNSPSSTTAASLPPHFEPHKRNLATSNQLPLLSPPTTSLPKASQWEQWLLRPPNQCINAFIGSNVDMPNANSNIFGKRVSSITLTTPANIMHQNIIKIYAHFLFLTMPHSQNSDCIWLLGMNAYTPFWLFSVNTMVHCS